MLTKGGLAPYHMNPHFNANRLGMILQDRISKGTPQQLQIKFNNMWLGALYRKPRL